MIFLDGNQIFYVTFEQDNSEEIPVQTLVQILEENPSELTETTMQQNDQSSELTNTLIMPEQPTELLSLEDGSETLPLPPNQVQVSFLKPIQYHRPHS